MNLAVDINCDLGELEGDAGLELDRSLLAYVTSASVACGMHAGDETRMRAIGEAASAMGVAIGAHPSYPDRANFGRVPMVMAHTDLRSTIRQQVELLMEIVNAVGGHVTYVKPHGALYHATDDPEIAEVVAETVRSCDSRLMIYGRSGSEMLRAGERAGLRVIHEVFADRAYQNDGALVSRTTAGALLTEKAMIGERVVEMIQRGQVSSVDRLPIPVRSDSVCVHSDTPQSLTILRHLQMVLHEAGIRVSSPGMHR